MGIRKPEPGHIGLRPALEWECPDCGRGNFTRFVFLKHEVPDEWGEVNEFDPPPGAWGHAPDDVLCRGCAKVWPVDHGATV